MSKVDWSLAPADADIYSPAFNGIHACWYKTENGKVYCWNATEPFWSFRSEMIGELIPRPAEAKQWSGPQDGLPQVGLEIEIKIDFTKAPPYTIITLTELGVDVQKHVPKFQKATVLYASSKYLVTDACGVECLTPMSCVELRAILSPEQKLQDKRETAIREIMDIADVDCRVTAARLVDAGFKREAV
jgi:hypothetical protein